jgi:hypothetical protein
MILSSSFLRLVSQRGEALGIIGDYREGTMHQFDVGQVVTCVLRYAAPGDYRVVGVMPDRDGDHIYRVKSPREEHERVVTEDALVRSDGYLPEETSEQRSLRENLTFYAAGSAAS